VLIIEHISQGNLTAIKNIVENHKNKSEFNLDLFIKKSKHYRYFGIANYFKNLKNIINRRNGNNFL